VGGGGGGGGGGSSSSSSSSSSNFMTYTGELCPYICKECTQLAFNLGALI
jgi:hypothetical protein